MNRIDLAEKVKTFANDNGHDIPTDAKEFYFIPHIFLMRQFPIDINNSNLQHEVVDIDMTTTPLYIKEGQEIVMRIAEGQLQFRIRSISMP